MNHQDRVLAAARMSDLMGQDSDVRMIVMRTIEKTGVRSFGELAKLHPDTFDEMVELIDAMNEQEPADLRPGFLR